MATHQYRGVGLRNVGSYQVSGDPYISGTIVPHEDGRMYRYQFPTVVKEVTVANLVGSNIITLSFVSGAIGFEYSSAEGAGVATSDADFNKSELGRGAHFWEIAVDASVTFKTKCKEIYITAMSGAAKYRILAELTNIPTGSMYHFTGSGKTEVITN